MKLNRTYERGQALILIVLAIVGMIGMVALAIDGGNAFSNRRSAQNAADTAALAGALAKVKNQSWSTAALARAASNNFNNDGTSNTVTVTSPPGAGCSGASGPYAGNTEYIQVIIRTTISTYFAPVVGITQLHNCVEAIARAKPAVPISLCYGALICALSPTDKNALRTFGTADVTLIGQGAFSNSNHSPQALYIASNQSLKIQAPYGAIAVGDINAPSGYLPPLTPYTTLPQLSYPLPDVMIPKYTCDFNVVDLPQGGVTNLAPGVYCLTGDFNKADYTNGVGGIGGVTIVMINKGLSWAGPTNITLNAPTSGPTAGLLIYLPYGNKNNSVKFTGNGKLNITGTILAPDIGSLILYNGNYSTATFRSQLVGWNLEFGGTALGSIYLPPIVYEYPGIPSVELAR